MKKSNLFSGIIIISLSLFNFIIAQTNINYLPNTVIIKIKPEYQNQCDARSIQIPQLIDIFQKIQVSYVKKKFPEQQSPKEKLNRWGQPLVDLSTIYEVKYSSNIPIQKVINALLSTNTLVYAEPYYIPEIIYTPNDPNVSAQYALTKIQAFNAWNVHQGDTNTVVGITDTGVEPTHSDLQNNMKKNYNDPIDGIDNDGDGYIDNFAGWDLGTNDNDPTWQGNAHGVHVSGIAAASTDNGTGIAGVGFKCKFLPVKIADAGGNLVASYEGIKYAAEQGCKVINCSWGGTAGGQYGQDIINYATFNYDALVVAACGNNSADQEFFPAAYDNVLAVASTDNTDVKSSFSNYGYYVGISAPGSAIYSTWNGNSYSFQSGTSMASPCVAGGAALVRSYFPSYNALQIMYRLRQTADNIYGLSGNASYQNKLGNGRLNLYRALTDPIAPYVVYQNINVTDNNDGLFLSGDTLRISGNFKNFLANATNLSATLTCLSPTVQVTPLSNTYNIGNLNTLASVNHSLSPFTFKVNFNFAPNTPITFKIYISDGTNNWTQFFYVYMNSTYINITVNDVFSTGTSNGRIGYNNANQSQGLGFTYNGNNLLYEAGLMFGINTTSVSNCVRNASGGTDNEFTTLANIIKIAPTSALSDMDTYAKFNDAASSTPMNVEVEQRTFAWSNIPNTKFIIWDYTFKNNQSTTLNNFYAGIFADFDIDASSYNDNKCAYDAGTKMGYTYRTTGTPLFAGIKLLTHTVTPVFYGIDNVNGGAGGVNMFDGYDKAEKYTTLSTNRLNAGQGATGNDVIEVMSAGPITIPAGQTVKVAFALIAGDSLQDLINSANQAQIMYDNLPLIIKNYSEKNNYLIYPNPAKDWIYIVANDKLHKSIEVTDVSGKMIYNNSFNSDVFAIYTNNWQSGVYFIKIVSDKSTITQKIIKE
ncbi:MAG: S8/S53 family peptidase [Bacteroidota bacterium]